MDELFLLSLTPSELRTYLALRHLADSSGLIKATMVELGEVTGYSRESIRLAVRDLESRGLVQTHRTKRNLGKLYKNEYQLLQVDLASTAVYTDTTSQLTTVTTKAVNTSYLLGADAPREAKMKKEILVGKWNPEEDDNIAGVGRFDDEIAIAKAGKPVSKRDPKTRYLRPQHEWTAADVASEFSSRVYARVRGIPGLVKTEAVRGALSKWRKEHGITALIELEIMDMYFADERILVNAKKNPKFIVGSFLRMFTTHLDKALENLGLPPITEEEPVVADSERRVYVYASDGKAFDNSLPGRKARDRYELSIKGK
jgi:predicted transcriptional regulator